MTTDKTVTVKTKAGTELPLIVLKGKNYLQVQHRLVWFREERPLWSIETSIVELSDQHAIFRSIVRDDQNRLISTGHKCETKAGFPDFMEKAETGSIGRALALCGYGTQFTDELEEGDRLADSPSPPPQVRPTVRVPSVAPRVGSVTRVGSRT